MRRLIKVLMTYNVGMMIAVQCVIAGASLKYPIFSWSQGPISIDGDVDIFFKYATRAVEGEVPYRDYLIEYPVGALPFFLVPRLFAGDVEGYRIAYAVEMLLCNIFTVLLVSRQVKRTEGDSPVPFRLGWYTLFFASLCPLLAGRYDLAPTAMAFAACYSWSSGWRLLGGALAGVGALTKIFPGIAMAPELAREVFSARTWRVRGAIAFVLVLLSALVPWFLIGRGGVTDSLSLHGKRGLEIESVFAGIVLVVSRFVPIKLLIIDNFGSSNLYFKYHELVLTVIPALQAGTLLLIAWLCVSRDGRNEFTYSAAAILGFIVTGKVLSPQYMIWLLPFIAVITGRGGMVARPLFLAACVLTRLIYPGPGFLGLLSNRLWAIALLNVRNAVLVSLLVCLVYKAAHEGNGRRVASVR